MTEKKVWLAANFASKMMSQGKPASLAIWKACDYYDVSPSEVNREFARRRAKKKKV